MKKIIYGMLAVMFVLPLAFGVVACKNKDVNVATETPAANVTEETETDTYKIWDGTIGDVPEASDGVITIMTAQQFAGFAKSVNDGNNYEGTVIKLGVDINLKNYQWTPIGYGDCNYLNGAESRLGPQFAGEFDGQNHTIYNLNITTFNKGGKQDGAAAGIALFGQLLGTVRNLKVDGAVVSGNHFVGVIAGYALNAVIDSCEVKNATVHCTYANNDNESGDKAGAVVGHIAKGGYENDSASITNCKAENCQIDAYRDAGQVIGCKHGATEENNTATNVVVTANHSHNDEKDGNNINNTIVGRVVSQSN